MISDGAVIAICAAIPPTILAFANLIQIMKIKSTTKEIHNATNGGLEQVKIQRDNARKELDDTYAKIRVLEAAAKVSQEVDRPVQQNSFKVEGV